MSDSAAPKQRVVVVIGASSGIGRATAHALASRGDHVVLTSRSPVVLEQVRQECVARVVGDVLVVPADVRRGARGRGVRHRGLPVRAG